MSQINKIVRELWRATYKGNDIDYIEIKSDDDYDNSAGADKRKTCNYRVIMVRKLDRFSDEKCFFLLPIRQLKNVHHSGDLYTRLVWYSNGQKLSDPRMVRYSNAI